jgi:hypothetical protein
MNEKKFFDFDVGTFSAGSGSLALTTSWVFTQPLPQLVQGTTASTRIGNKIFLHSIYYQIIMTPSISMGTSGGLCRFATVHDKENAATATPNATNIFQADSCFSLRNTTMSKRYALTGDVTHTYMPTSWNNTGSSVATVGPVKILSFAQHPRRVIDYISNSNTDATCLLKDNYFIGYICSVGGCTIAMKIKMIFSDA